MEGKVKVNPFINTKLSHLNSLSLVSTIFICICRLGGGGGERAPTDRWTIYSNLIIMPIVLVPFACDSFPAPPTRENSRKIGKTVKIKDWQHKLHRNELITFYFQIFEILFSFHFTIHQFSIGVNVEFKIRKKETDK